MKLYKIIRYNITNDKENEVIKTGLSLGEAQEHCLSEDTHEVDSKGHTIWFDGYIEE